MPTTPATGRTDALRVLKQACDQLAGDGVSDANIATALMELSTGRSAKFTDADLAKAVEKALRGLKPTCEQLEADGVSQAHMREALWELASSTANRARARIMAPHREALNEHYANAWGRYQDGQGERPPWWFQILDPRIESAAGEAKG